jgi:hypothetical protein
VDNNVPQSSDVGPGNLRVLVPHRGGKPGDGLAGDRQLMHDRAAHQLIAREGLSRVAYYEFRNGICRSHNVFKEKPVTPHKAAALAE